MSKQNPFRLKSKTCPHSDEQKFRRGSRLASKDLEVRGVVDHRRFLRARGWFRLALLFGHFPEGLQGLVGVASKSLPGDVVMLLQVQRVDGMFHLLGHYVSPALLGGLPALALLLVFDVEDFLSEDKMAA